MASYTFSIYASPQQGGEVSLDGVNYQASVTSTVTTITDRTLYARAANGWEVAANTTPISSIIPQPE